MYEYVLITTFVSLGAYSGYQHLSKEIDSNFCSAQAVMAQSDIGTACNTDTDNEVVATSLAQVEEAEIIDTTDTNDIAAIMSASIEPTDTMEIDAIMSEPPSALAEKSLLAKEVLSSQGQIKNIADLGIDMYGSFFNLGGQKYQGFKNYHDYAIYKNRFSHGDKPVHVFLTVNNNNLRLYPTQRAGYYESYRTQEGVAVFHTSGGNTYAINTDGSVGKNITINPDSTISQQTLQSFVRSDFENMGLDVDGKFFTI